MASEAIDKVLVEKGEDWLVAAIIEGSIGYSGVKAAEILIDDYRRGTRECYSERCMCCFKCSLVEMLEFDIRFFERLWRLDPAKAEGYLAHVKATRDLPSIEQASLGLFLPTMG